MRKHAAVMAAMMALLGFSGWGTADEGPGGANHSHPAIVVTGDQRCISSNGLPNHSTGRFPNSGNPNSISEQQFRFCVDATPVKGRVATANRGTVGIAVNGIPIRPGTADFWDPNGRRGFSRQGDRAWHLEGLGNREILGMDQNNAHVDRRGMYHYHGTPTGLLAKNSGTLIGYAADGFEIHYVGDAKKSSYTLKPGVRPSGPGGKYDGTFLADWQYTPGSGDLDQCNGGMLNGTFVYFVTDKFPFYPRCLWGEPSPDFARGRRRGR